MDTSNLYSGGHTSLYIQVDTPPSIFRRTSLPLYHGGQPSIYIEQGTHPSISRRTPLPLYIFRRTPLPLYSGEPSSFYIKDDTPPSNTIGQPSPYIQEDTLISIFRRHTSLQYRRTHLPLYHSLYIQEGTPPEYRGRTPLLRRTSLFLYSGGHPSLYIQENTPSPISRRTPFLLYSGGHPSLYIQEDTA